MIEFVARETSVPAHRLSLQTDVGRDLGVDGDEGIDLMLHFAARFAVDLARFDAAEHFGPEAAFNPLALLRPSWWRARRRMRPVTVGDLVRAAVMKRWTTVA